MIRNLLATTAVATLIATGAMAQATAPAPTAPAAEPAAPMVKVAEGELASNVIGESVYNGSGDDAEKIGDVNDLVINPDGTVKAIVVGVGGFLGLGQKNVALEYDLIEWVERDNDRWIVIATTADALKALPDFDPNAYEYTSAGATETQPATSEDLASAQNQAAAGNADGDQAAAPPADTPVQPADEPADTAEAPAQDGGGMATAPAPADGAADQQAMSDQAEQPAASGGETAATAEQPAAPDEETTAAIDRSTLTEVEAGQISTDQLVGTTVYGANDENVGEIGDVVMSQDGQVDAVIIDVGGFLGMGKKKVAVGLDNLSFMSDSDGDYYLYTNFTKEQLEAAAEYDEARWAENRDQMRLVAPN